jgi:hypothetical protein
MATCATWAPRLGASCAEASRPAWRGAALAAEAGTVLRAFLGARPAEPCLHLLGGKGKAGSGYTKKEPGHKYPQILTRSGLRPIVPAGRPFGPRSPQAPPRFAPLPASVPFPLRKPGAPKGRPAHATSRRPKDQPPVRPARATDLGGHASRSDSLGSPQLPRPRGQVPPQPAPTLRTGTLMSRPRYRRRQPTRGLARRPLAQPQIRAKAKAGRHVVVLVILVVIVIVRRLRRWLPREPVPLLPPSVPLQGVPSPHPLASPSLFRVLLLLHLLRGDPPRGSVYRVLRDRRQGRLVTPQLLGTNGNPDCENQGQPDTRKEKDRTLTRDMHPRSGHIKGWVRAPASSLPTVPATRLRRSSAERGTEDICEPSKSTPTSSPKAATAALSREAPSGDGWRQPPPRR